MSSDISVGVLNTLLPGSSSSSESCDDEILEMLCEDSESEDEMVLTELAKSSSTKRNCIKNYLNDVIPPHYTEAEFRHHYKISMPLFESLSKKMEDSEDYKKMRPDKRLSAKTHIAVFLWFAGHEACSYRDVAERFNLCIASVCRVIHRTSMFLSNIAPNVIVFPSKETKLRRSNLFASKCSFRKAIECIEKTSIVVDPPSDRKDGYIDRKRHVSLSLPEICNEKKKFKNGFLGHPGSCHNSWLPDSSSSSESSDDEILEMLCEDSASEDEMILTELAKRSSTKRNCIKTFLNDVKSHYTESEFRHHYRISMSLFESLSKKMEDSKDYKKMRPDKRLSAKTHLAVFLWFAGHEACSYRDVADRFNLCIASVCRVIHRTSMFLSNMAPNVIVWPSEETKLRSSKFFASKCGFNKAIGCIDGTRIVIDPPSDREDEFIDRKGNVSLSLQGICNEEKKFINVFLGHPGSCHDSWILQNSPIYSKLVSACGDFYLLGDSAYPCTQHIITPYRDNGHLTSAQKDFNITLNSGRVAIEHTFGILKQRFRQLYYCKIKGIKKLCQFIMAACVLHNIANENDFDFMNEEAEGIDDLDPQPESMQTNLIRDAIWQQMQTKSHKCNIRETLK